MNNQDKSYTLIILILLIIAYRHYPHIVLPLLGIISYWYLNNNNQFISHILNIPNNKDSTVPQYHTPHFNSNHSLINFKQYHYIISHHAIYQAYISISNLFKSNNSLSESLYTMDYLLYMISKKSSTFNLEDILWYRNLALNQLSSLTIDTNRKGVKKLDNIITNLKYETDILIERKFTPNNCKQLKDLLSFPRPNDQNDINYSHSYNLY